MPEVSLEMFKIDDSDLQARIQEQQGFIASSFKILEGFEVTSDAERREVEEILMWIKKRFNGIEDARKAAVSSYTGAVEIVNSSCRPVKRKLRDIESQLKGLLAAFERTRREKQRAQIAAVAEAAEAGDEEVAEEMLAEVRAPEKSQGISLREVWAYKVLKAAEVPAKYWVLDDAAIRKDIAAGVRKIEGLEIYQDISVAVRSR